MCMLNLKPDNDLGASEMHLDVELEVKDKEELRRSALLISLNH